MATRLQWWRDRLRDPEWMLALATIALGVIAFAFSSMKSSMVLAELSFR